MTPDFVAALYEAALDPSGLRPLMTLVGNHLGINGMATCLAEDLLLSDHALKLDIAESQQHYLDHVQDRTVEGCEARDTPQQQSALTAILPHLRHALLLRLRTRNTSVIPQSLAFAVLTFGVVICDRLGRVLHANAAAEVLARDGIGIAIRAKDRTITALIGAETTRLMQLIQIAATMHRSGGLVLTARDGTARLMALVTPLQPRDHAEIDSGTVLVALRQIGGSPAFGLTLLTDLFRLSPAQAALAIGLYEGKSFEQIAAERGVKVTTLRTHFAEVLSRTGSKSLRDLVRLLGSIPPLR